MRGVQGLYKGLLPDDVIRQSQCIMGISPGAKGLKWRFFAHESVQAEFGLKL